MLSPQKEAKAIVSIVGARLVGHPSVFSNICMQSRGDLNQRERERDADNETKPKTKQQQQVREVRLDVGAVAGVRVEEEERGRVNTRGTTNRHGLCFPSAWKEEEEKRDDGEQQNNQTTRKKENHQPQC